MADQEETGRESGRSFPKEGRISARFRNWNIALFALASCVMVVAMLASFHYIVGQVSADYAMRYAASSADTLSAHIVKEIALMAKAARSSAVTDWLAEEGNDAKKTLAYEEMLGAFGQMYSNNLYIGVTASRHEYRIDKDFTAAGLSPFDTLDEDDPEDKWYFDCDSAEGDYLISVGIDRVLGRKRVWLDYKIVHEGASLGVLSTGLEFSHVVGSLFSNYDRSIRGLIVDANGVIHMDSARMEEQTFLNSEFKPLLEDEFTDPALLSAIRARTGSADRYFEDETAPSVADLRTSQQGYATIAPIRYTDWSVVILHDRSASLSIWLFLPALLVMFVLLIVFAFATHTVSARLIFSPLAQLVDSLGRLKEDKDAPIYGTGRDDEFGNLANTILDLFNKANRDALTGLYNRRLMESELERVMRLLSRGAADSRLSVLMIDIDYFKKYNDAYGHEEGDVCLRKVAQALAGIVTRANDFVARYGGEEFFAVLPHTDEAGARVIAQRMIDTVQELALPHSGSTVAPCVTVSIGVSTGAVQPSQSWEDFSKRADEALYMSKQTGRNRYTYLDLPAQGADLGAPPQTPQGASSLGGEAPLTP